MSLEKLDKLIDERNEYLKINKLKEYWFFIPEIGMIKILGKNKKNWKEKFISTFGKAIEDAPKNYLRSLEVLSRPPMTRKEVNEILDKFKRA